MAMKFITLITVLVVVLVATQAEANLIFELPRSFNISGNVSCSMNGTGANLPPFPDAVVVLRCAGVMIAGATTDEMGSFSFIVPGVQSNLISSSCNLNVVSPLANCNATLPAQGILRAPIQSVGTATDNITDLFSGIFSLF